MTAVYNPLEPGFIEDPYEQYRRLRAEDPVHHSPLGFWMLTRYADVQRVLRDPGMSVEDRNAAPQAIFDAYAEMLGDRERRGERAMLNVDPPDHTRLRRLVTKAFTPRVIENLRPRVGELVGAALDRAAEQGTMDLVGDLAFPLPLAVITDMLGMPDVDMAQLRRWSHQLVKTLDPIMDPSEIPALIEAGDGMRALVTSAIEHKRSEPADDLLTALVHAEDAGDMLTEDELLDQVLLLYIAGHETTVNLIGNGTLALLHHPAELRALREDPGLVAGAIEELLRYDSPVQVSRRITLCDFEIEGCHIDKGTFLATSLASANRDEARWGDTADRVDVRRPDANHHVAFGGGAHYCLGAALARLEGQEVIAALVRRFASIELDGEPVYNGRINLRGLDHLPLRVAA